MIYVGSPSMAINDQRAAVRYTMDETRTVGSAKTMTEIVNLINARSTQIGKRIDNLILTGHGAPGFFEIGTGLNINTMEPFRRLAEKVHKIWFRGCLVARIINAQTTNEYDWGNLKSLGITSGNGHAFISAFARLTGCYVVAPTEVQGSNRSVYPHGVMDTYEGLVLGYDPQGNVTWQGRNPSNYGFNSRDRTQTMANFE